ncbi:hypothetical protein D1BOALGB6SA_793 [Olavius sp. associated proteobacterium Delta 1]|nr:hypothetical protein D1BOALGB6SA_793 [Olavius sp. associated proteobacterium Delta 1]
MTNGSFLQNETGPPIKDGPLLIISTITFNLKKSRGLIPEFCTYSYRHCKNGYICKVSKARFAGKNSGNICCSFFKIYIFSIHLRYSSKKIDVRSPSFKTDNQ